MAIDKRTASQLIFFPGTLHNWKAYYATKLVFCIVAWAMCFGAIYVVAPPLEPYEMEHVMKIPENQEELEKLACVLSNYVKRNQYPIGCVFIAEFIFFNIVDVWHLFLSNFIIGFVFPMPLSILICGLVTVIGCSVDYLLGMIKGRWFLAQLNRFSEINLKKWAYSIRNDPRESIFAMLMGYRFMPLVPDWFINCSAPLIGIPFWTFFWGTFIAAMVPLGSMPVFIGAGFNHDSPLGVRDPIIIALLTIFYLGFPFVVFVLFAVSALCHKVTRRGRRQQEVQLEDPKFELYITEIKLSSATKTKLYGKIKEIMLVGHFKKIREYIKKIIRQKILVVPRPEGDCRC